MAMAYTTPYRQRNLYRDQSGTALPSQALWCQVQAGPASTKGYRGDVDGVMGPNSWRGFAYGVKVNFFSDIADPEPAPEPEAEATSAGDEVADDQ